MPGKKIIRETVGAYEAKTHFSEILEQVAQGATITITKHGTAVAKLVPAKRIYTPEERRAAIALFREQAKGNILGDDVTIKELIEMGRK